MMAIKHLTSSFESLFIYLKQGHGVNVHQNCNNCQVEYTIVNH